MEVMMNRTIIDGYNINFVSKRNPNVPVFFSLTVREVRTLNDITLLTTVEADINGDKFYGHSLLNHADIFDLNRGAQIATGRCVKEIQKVIHFHAKVNTSFIKDLKQFTKKLSFN